MTYSLPKRLAKGVALAGCLSVFIPGTTAAFESTGNAVADAFLTLLEAEDGTIESYGGISGSDGTFTISDLVIKNDDGGEGQVTIGATALAEAELLENGRLKVSSLAMTDLHMTDEDGRVALESLSASGLLLPSPEDIKADTVPVGPGYQAFTATQLQIFESDEKIADIQSVSSSVEGVEGELPTAGSLNVTGATINVEQLETEETKALRDLGYSTLSLNISASGTWDPDAATIDIPELKIDARDAAALSLSLSLGGATEEVLKKLNESTDNPQEAMALAQNITINSARIRLDDASLTGRILEQKAKKAGVDVPTYVTQTTSTLPLMLGMLQNKDLEAQVSQAVTTYLNAPGSLEINASPGAPVAVAQIMGAAMFSPQAIPQILSLSIMANQ